MPLSLDDVLQSNKGGAVSTSQEATLGAGTTAGSTLYLFVDTYSQSVSTITGFALIRGPGATNNRVSVWRKTDVAAAETSWPFTVPSATHPTIWVILEVQGVDVDAPEDVIVAAATNTTTGTTFSSGTTPTSTTYDGMVLVAHGLAASGTTPPTISAQTNGVAEVQNQQLAGATISTSLAVCALGVQALGAWTSTATSSVTMSSTQNGIGVALVATATGAKRAADLRVFAGFEWGTDNGIGTTSQLSPFDSAAGTPEVLSGAAARSGSYYCRLQSGDSLTWAGAGPLGSSSVYVAQVPVRFETSLPGSNVSILVSTAANVPTLRYKSSTQKLAVQFTGGSEVESDQTVVADTWFDVYVRIDRRTTTHKIDWEIDYRDGNGLIVQTQATLAGQTAGSAVGDLTFAGPVLVDDLAVSSTPGHHPLGDHQVTALKADPGGTLTVSGSTSNFGVMTANGTIAAWNAANALAAIDELPPTIGASADGIVQVTVATTEYVDIPMETIDVSGVGSVRAVRLYFAGWAASATTATIGFRAHDGTTEYTLAGAFDPSFDNSTTAMAWVAFMVKPAGGWTQARLDALAARVGFSGDATPDIGILGVVAEVVVQPADTYATFGTSDDVLVDAKVDPVSGGVLALDVTTPVARPAELTYEIGGTPSTLSVPGGDSDSVAIDAPDAPTVGYIKLETQP